MEPALGVDDFGGALGVLVVAQHHIAAAHADLAVVQLDLAVAVRLADGTDVLCVVGKVDQAAAGGLGAAVELSNEHAVLGQIHQDLRLKHGGHAVQCPQVAQFALFAGHQVVVNGLHQHRHGGHGLAGHPLEILIEGPQAAQVLGPAHLSPGEQAAEGTQMEHGQHGQVAHQHIRVMGGFQIGLAHAQVVVHHGKEVCLAQHDALAAARGAGGEHQHHQSLRVDAVHKLCRLVSLVGIHGAQQAAVSRLHLLVAAVVIAVGQDGGRLHQLQLPVQLIPALALVHGHDDAARHHDTVAVHGVVVAVVAPHAHPLALNVRDGAQAVVHRAADVLRILPEVLFHHHILVGVVPAEGHPVRKSLLHVQRQQLIQIFRFMQFHDRFPLYSLKSQSHDHNTLWELFPP